MNDIQTDVEDEISFDPIERDSESVIVDPPIFQQQVETEVYGNSKKFATCLCLFILIIGFGFYLSFK